MRWRGITRSCRAPSMRMGASVFHVLGDGFCSAFEDAGEALRAALEAQRALHSEDWGDAGRRSRAHGLAHGKRGGAQRRLRRLADAGAHAASRCGRTRRTDAALRGDRATRPRQQAAVRNDAARPRRAQAARDRANRRRIYQFVAADLPSEFPPLRVEDVAASPAAPLQQLVRGRLVGRAAEQQQLRQRWSEAQQARGQLVLLSGEPGVGKTPPGAGPDRARAAERRDRPARRVLRVRGDDAVPALRRGLPRMDAPAKCRAACGTRLAHRARRSASSRRRSRRSSARLAPPT